MTQERPTDKGDRLTRRQAAIVGAFTGFAAGPFEDVQLLGDELMGYPTFTHQYGSKEFVDDLKEKARPLFVAIAATRDVEP
jgi:hypothetical protein